MNPDRFFDAAENVRTIARALYVGVRDLPLISPHGHVDPQLFAENQPFPDPAELFIIPDHYIFRMLYSQGVSLESLGIPQKDGTVGETDRRKVWRRFAENYYLFAGTPSGIWLNHELCELFDIQEKLNGDNADDIFDQIQAKLAKPEYLPRALFDRFNLEVLTTTDNPWDALSYHRQIKDSDWDGEIVPCFRPDGVTDISRADWQANIEKLSEASGIWITNYRQLIRALEDRRAFFKSMGTVSTDHGVQEALTLRLTEEEADRIFQKALKGNASAADARRFTAHMLMEMARMSCDDGLIMHLHVGALRNHNEQIFKKFGPDKGADIPIVSEFTVNLKPLLNAYGSERNFHLIVFTLDESTYSRELAPLAGHYPALRLGPAWWFHDSIQGMIRFRERTLETAGVYNLIGFIDDTRAFPSIPARHDLARRIDSNYLAGLVAKHIINMAEAQKMNYALAYGLSREMYRKQ
ncbi:MAG TPA: glucuronate isomerase [Candidatus Marinimicrobia bacterium]|nr:glucuronate isomerase [Candidatus Neomarinimicrobiota bacterium]